MKKEKQVVDTTTKAQSELKQTEDSLHQSEEMYRLLARNLPDTSVFLFDHNLRFILAEGSLPSGLGFTSDIMEGKTIWDVLPKERADRLAHLYKNALEGKSTENYISEFGGNSYSVNISPVKNKQGEIVAGMVVSRDITEQKQAEEALRESEEKWRKLVYTLPEYVALHDRDGKYLFLNHFAEGFSMKDIEGKTYTHFLSDDSKPVYEQAFNKAKQTNANQYIEYSALGDNRIFRHYESHFVPMFENNEFVNMMVIARDITEHKRAEAEILKSKQQYDNLVSKIPVGVYILRTKPDDTFALEYASPKMAEMLDLSVESLLAHHETIFKAIHPDDLEDFSRLNMNGIRQKQPFDWKGRIVVKGGEKWLHISSMPQQVENGEVLWHGLIVDITKRMHDEAEIKLKNEELQNLNATKDKFFSIIAHDLKSPFNSIVGFSGLLVELVQENNFDGIREYTKIVHESASQAMDLLMNLLEWSRSQTGRMTFKPVVSDMSSLINNATELFGDSARLKSITIRTELPTDSMVLVDQIMMGTVLRNLISNAIKFTRPGGQILVSAEQREGEWWVSVSDNGIGIKKDDVKKLFRLEENYTTLGTNNEKGTGLGLILCKEFVEKHGGKIWVESEEGNGSTFSFTIPLS